MALSGAYKAFNDDNDIVKNIKSVISSGIWSTGANTLTAFYTQSAQSSSTGKYFYDVYKTDHTDTEREVQFSITYGHIHGSGSAGAVGTDGNRASATIYRQLSQTFLGPNEEKFTFDPGNWDWCPENEGTELQHICQKSITPERGYKEVKQYLI